MVKCALKERKPRSRKIHLNRTLEHLEPFQAPNRNQTKPSQALKTVTSLNKEARLLNFHFS